MVVSWPAKIKDKGGIRSQFTHLIDMVPTILDVANNPTPAQSLQKFASAAMAYCRPT